MEKKGLKVFEDALKADETLRQRYEEVLGGVTEAASDGEAMQKAAAELGYEITLEELEQAWAAGQELDEKELASVAGGLYENDDEWCVMIHSCYTVAFHDREGKANACWSDYSCAVVYHH